MQYQRVRRGWRWMCTTKLVAHETLYGETSPNRLRQATKSLGDLSDRRPPRFCS